MLDASGMTRALALTAGIAITIVWLMQQENNAAFSFAKTHKLLRGRRGSIVAIPDATRNIISETASRDSNSDLNTRYRTTQELQVVRPAKRDNRIDRRLAKIEGFGGEPDPWLFPLQECQGDCDDDSDCDEGLVCFQRLGGEDVPGCWGKTDNAIRTDYCIKDDVNNANSGVSDGVTIANAQTTATSGQQRKPGGSLNVVGQNGVPASVYPLGLCEGECDRDSDCNGSLVCHQRQPGEPVPGCQGSEGYYSRGDFCIYPLTWSPTWTPTWSPTWAPSSATDTANAAVSPTALTMEPTFSATVGGSASATDMNTVAMTDTPSLAPSSAPTATYPVLQRVGNNGAFATFPLGNCMGDCDTNDDCAEGLICYLRTGTPEVPGCRGVGDYSVDYCIVEPEVFPGVEAVDDVKTDPTLEPSILDPAVVVSAVERQADTLPPPMERDVETPDFVLSATEKHDDHSSQLPRLQMLGADNVFETYPLDICQGSCFHDEDCLPGLRCFQRQGLEPVPGCAGRGHNSANYCIPDAVLSAVGSDFIWTTTPTTFPSMTDTVPVTAMASQTFTFSPSDAGSMDSTFGSTNVLAAVSSTTAMPTDAATLPTLSRPQIVGNDNVFDVYPLAACQGDCDTDDDCKDGLRCYQRKGRESVPGCDPNSLGEYSADYCVEAKYATVENVNATADGDVDSDAQHQAEVDEYSWTSHAEDAATSDIDANETAAESSYNLTTPVTDQEDAEEAIAEDIAWDEEDEVQDVITAPPLIPFGWDEETLSPSQADTAQPTFTSSETLAPSQAATAQPTLTSSETLAPSQADTAQPTLSSSGVLSALSTPTVDPLASESANLPVTLAPTMVASAVPSSQATVAALDTENESLPETLTIVFDPSSLLAECEGDCNSHQDCAGGLLCYHRNGNEIPVPGCTGVAPSVADFCVDMKYMMNDHTEADVEDDADAEAEAQVEEEAWEEEIADAASPTASPSFVTTLSPTVQATSGKLLAAIGATTVVPSSPEATVSPGAGASVEETLQMTEASTGSPSDSGGTSTADPSIESTLGLTLSPSIGSTNSTVMESAMETTFAPSESETTSAPPSAGESDEGALDTFLTNTPTNNLEETLSPSSNLSLPVIESAAASTTLEPSMTYSPSLLKENATSFPTSNSSDFDGTETAAPTEMPYLRMVGNDGIFDTFPLEECEGDCDQSDDCNGPGLVCMQRIANEPVPGCQGLADFSVDYCVKVEYFMTDGDGLLLDDSMADADFGG